MSKAAHSGPNALDMYPDMLQPAGRLFRVEDRPDFLKLLADYKAAPCEPQALFMREIVSLELNPIAWLYVLSFAFSLQTPEK